jgi:transcriptional regulator with XRE-family HTH domain
MERKTNKYQAIKDNIGAIEKLARHGFSEEDIEEFLGISAALLREFLKKSTEISRKIKNAKLQADLDVEESLLKRASGYETIEEYYVYVPSGSEKDEEEGSLKIKEMKKVKKFVPPDATSAMAWLINRRSEKWSKNPGIVNELSGNEITKLKRLAVKEMQENM